jgi:hypothetical protein
MAGWFRENRDVIPLAGDSASSRGLSLLGPVPGGYLSLPSAVVFFVVLGSFFRIVRYAQNLPLWSDECFLAVNFIGRGYADLLQPLDNGQIAPLLFLWIQRFTIDLVGFSEWGLRLFPLLCGLTSLFLFWRLAGRVQGFNSLPSLLAVGIFAVSVHPIRHTAEAKPYASDLLVALALLVPAAEWLHKRDSTGWIWALVVIAPLALLLSNPAVFVAGGIVLGLLVPVWRTGRWLTSLAVGSFSLVLIVAFCLIYTSFGMTQSEGAMAGLRQYWALSFPPLMHPSRMPAWLFWVHTGSTFAYPGGGARGASTATFVAFLVGAAVLTRRGQGAVVACLTAPFGLAFLAAAIGRYPYGGEARLMQFAAPSICLLAGQGAAATLCSIPRARARARRVVLGAGLLGLIVCGTVPQIVSFKHPYRMLYDHQEREFARRFWTEEAKGAKLACAHLDYGIDSPGSWQGRRAWYLCNQMIYSPSRHANPQADVHPISSDRPLRCVVHEESAESPNVRPWLARMQRRFMLQQVRTVDLNVTVGEGIPSTEHWRVFEFVPRSGGSGQTMIGQESVNRRSY